MWNVTEWDFINVFYINRRIGWTPIVNRLGRVLDNVESTAKAERGILTL